MDTMLNLDEREFSLDQLALIGRELSDDELRQATGGILPLIIMFGCGFAMGFAGAALYDVAMS